MTNAADRPRRALVLATSALLAAVALALTFPGWSYRVPYGVGLSASYLLTWGPMIAALIMGFWFWRPLLTFRAADLGLGLMIGLLGRAIGILAQYLFTSQLPQGGVVFGGVTGLYVFTAVIAPVVIAPLIEEPFFRGLLQGSLDRVAGRWVALLATSAVFALVHTIADGWSGTLIVTLLAYALIAGYVTQRTGRLGPAIIGHAVFNGLAVLITWPW